jgi:hypothetical protein
MRPDSEIRDAIRALCPLREALHKRGCREDAAAVGGNIRMLIWALGDIDAPTYGDTDKFLQRLIEANKKAAS